MSNTLAFEGPDPSVMAMSNDMAARVRKCLDTLTDVQRRSVTLAFFEGAHACGADAEMCRCRWAR